MRSKVLATLGAVALALGVSACGTVGSTGGSTSTNTVTVSIGRQPYAGANSPITQYMINHKLVQKYAKKLGVNLKVDWRDYPSAIPMVTDMLGNKLDIGMWGDTPIIRAIATNEPVSLLSMGEGHLEFFLITRKGSGIRNFHDLKGKTVGVLLGGDPNFAFSEMLQYTLGSSNPQKLGIKLVNTPTQAEAGSLPSGMDAAVVILPEYLQAKAANPNVVAIANSFGYTDSYYKGSAGTGAGHLIPGVKKSPFYPEGFYLHRSFWVINNKFLSKYPKVAQAFVEAEQDAVNKEAALGPGPTSQLVKQYWKLNSTLGGRVVKQDLMFVRGWVWPTQGDYYALVAVSKNLVGAQAISQPLTWQQVENNAKETAPILKAAYKAMGSTPPESAFTQKSTLINGYPVWQMSKWNPSNP